MAVGADQCLAGDGKTFQVKLVADAVAGTRKINTVLFCDRADKTVVVRIFKAGLKGIVVDISDRTLGFNTVDPHCLKFKVGHGTGCVLGQGLVDF